MMVRREVPFVIATYNDSFFSFDLDEGDWAKTGVPPSDSMAEKKRTSRAGPYARKEICLILTKV